MSSEPTQAQIDEAERLGRLYGLTYLSGEGYAKLAAVIDAVDSGRMVRPALVEIKPERRQDADLPSDWAGWRVG
jgi:hypothetical protein